MARISKFPFIIATMLIGVLASCGGSSSSAPTTALIADVVVTAKSGLRLDQTSYSASSGEISIGYINDDTIRHTLVIAMDGKKVAGFELDVSKKGSTDQATVTLEPGTYELLCTVPGHQSMKSSFEVK